MKRQVEDIPLLSLVGDEPQTDLTGGGTNSEGKNKNSEEQTTNTNKRKRRRIRKNKEIQLAIINARGIKGKIKSLEAIIKTNKIKIAAITETHLKNEETLNIKGYKWIGRNRKKQQGGGVGILVSSELTGSTTKIEDVEEYDKTETIWIEIKTRPKPLYIGTFYGPQEGNKKEDTEMIYTALETQINQLKQKGEVIIAGDFNAKLEHKQETVTQEESRNGKILQQMMTNQQLTALNLKADHGMWTRINRKNIQEKSIIDYIIATEGIKKDITAIIVDEEGSLRIQGKNESDHNTITATIKINQKTKPRYIKRWNINNKEGWTMFNQNILDKLEKAEWKNHQNIQDQYDIFEKTILDTLRATIGETKIRTDKPPKPKSDQIKKKRAEMKRTKQMFQEACKNGTPTEKQETAETYITAQKELRKEIEEHERTILEKKLHETAEAAKTNPNVIWELKKKTQTNNELEYETIDADGKKIMDPEQTKDHIASYFENLYQARPGTPEYQTWTEEIEKAITHIREEYQHNREDPIPITTKELNKTIKKLKRKKSNGPDNIPNEIFLEAGSNTTKIYTEMYNKIYQSEEIPTQWLLGEVIRLYKGKGIKGKCENERGITLASNVGKVFERIINERAKPSVHITDAQAGGKEGAATVDHLITLKEAINTIKKMKKTAYIIFLDVQKAYDKAWLDAIMYVMHKNGLRGKNWEIMRKLNTNLQATIRTKYGNTRKIQIKDSIRQGGVLSVLQYATIIDEIAKELDQRNLGMDMEGLGKLGCLLWMDDVALVHHDLRELQKMMNATNDIAQRYHIEFGAAKCKVVRIGPGKKSSIKLGETVLEETENYKYLGEILNKKATRKDHIKALKGKANGAFNNITAWTGNKEFKSIRMKAIWKLIDMCIIPIITYGAEAATHTTKEVEEIQQIFNNLLRKLLNLPQSTPNMPLLIETGYLPIEYYMDRKRIMQANRVENSKQTTLIKRTIQGENNEWMTKTKETMEKYNITMEDINGTKNQLKEKVTKNQIEHFKARLTKERETKSKLRHLMDNKSNPKLGERPKHMNELSRKQCRAIMLARTRMIPVKANHKGSHKNQDCRWCNKKDTQETQEHILIECEALTSKTKPTFEYKEIFDDSNSEKLRSIAESLITTIETLTDENQPVTDRNKQRPNQINKTNQPII